MSSSNDKVIKIIFNPKESELSDVFENEIACALWCMYRDSHIISGDGLNFLNQTCRELIKTKNVFTRESAQAYLHRFINKLNLIESARLGNDVEWINKTIPFLTCEKKIKLEIVSSIIKGDTVQ